MLIILTNNIWSFSEEKIKWLLYKTLKIFNNKILIKRIMLNIKKGNTLKVKRADEPEGKFK